MAYESPFRPRKRTQSQGIGICRDVPFPEVESLSPIFRWTLRGARSPQSNIKKAPGLCPGLQVAGVSKGQYFAMTGAAKTVIDTNGRYIDVLTDPILAGEDACSGGRIEHLVKSINQKRAMV
jgi:hypothetical protein